MRSKRFEYDYWALGHVHTRETLRDLHPHIAFPGNIQGRHIRESGPKGCLLVTVDTDNVPVVEFRPLDVLRWEVCRVDASDAEDGDAILDRFDGALRAILSKSDKDHLIAARVEIVGATQAHQTLVGKLDHWEAQIRSVSNDVGRGQVWVEKVRAKTTSPRLLELDAHALGSIEELVAVVDELRADPALLRSFVVRELDDLRRRLDRDIHATDDLLGLGDDEALLGLIESASPLILEKLNANPSAKS